MSQTLKREREESKSPAEEPAAKRLCPESRGVTRNCGSCQNPLTTALGAYCASCLVKDGPFVLKKADYDKTCSVCSVQAGALWCSPALDGVRLCRGCYNATGTAAGCTVCGICKVTTFTWISFTGNSATTVAATHASCLKLLTTTGTLYEELVEFLLGPEAKAVQGSDEAKAQ